MRRRRLAGLAAVGLLVALAAQAVLARRAAARRVNVVLVTLDTLRADHVGAYGCSTCETPTLDALARRGLRFANAESAVPLTGPSHATILTGLYPPAHGVRDNVSYVLDARHETLAQRLKAAGYRTAAFISGYPVAAAFGFGRGFDSFDEGLHQTPAFGEGAERPANEVADAAIAWLAHVGAGPFFAWVHLYDAHAPYTPPEPWATRFRDRPYDGEIAFADAQLGRILEALKRAGHGDDTLIVAVADHGESLGEHGETAHAVLVYEAVLHVPLLIAGPAVPAGLVAGRVSTADILPSLLAHLGLAPPEGLSGADLKLASGGAGRAAAEPIYAESLFGRLNCRWASLRVLTSGDWKLIDGASPELFHLGDDPREQHDLALHDPDRVLAMRRALRSAVGRLAPEGDRAVAVALSPEQEETLRSLGYVGGGGATDVDRPGLPDPRGRVHLYEQFLAGLAYQGPDVDRALAGLERLVEEDTENPFGQFALAALAWRAGRPDLAGRAFAATLALDPERPGRRYHYGRFLREAGRYDDAERQLRMAVAQTTPDDYRTRLALAQTLLDLDRGNEAETVLRAVLEKEPQHVQASALMGRLLASRGARAEAFAYYRAGTRDDEPEPWIEVAELHLSANDAARAVAAVNHALERSPAHPWALAVLGRALLMEGRRAEAEVVLAKALRVTPRTHDAWAGLARAFDAAGNKGLAATCRARGEKAREQAYTG